jgi:hypothetical protein
MSRAFPTYLILGGGVVDRALNDASHWKVSKELASYTMGEIGPGPFLVGLCLMPILVAILAIAARDSEWLIHAYCKTILPDGAVVIQKTMTQTSAVLDQIQSPNM